jgi:hypothetical protein
MYAYLYYCISLFNDSHRFGKIDYSDESQLWMAFYPYCRHSYVFDLNKQLSNELCLLGD